MNYGALLSRAWNIIWEHKFLILLGVLVALGSIGGGGGGASTGGNLAFDRAPGEGPRMPELPQMPALPDLRAVAPGVGILAILVIAALVVILLAVWVASTIARGGLIAGVSALDQGGSSSFAQAWNAGWRKGWRLLGISVLPAIPALLLVILGVGAFVVAGGAYRTLGAEFGAPAVANLGIIAALTCTLVPIALVLGLLRTFADRACMLEDRGVFGAYRLGLRVLLDNVGPALILFLIQIAIGIGIAIVGFLPGLLAALCCVLWPLLILVQGAISAYFSTVWTLAWRTWTGSGEAAQAPLSATVAP
jgi:hypothetical protein